MNPRVDPWIQWLAVSSVYALVITLVLSPLLLWLYRRRVARWMGQGTAGTAPPVPMTSDAGPRPRWLRLAGPGGAAPPGWGDAWRGAPVGFGRLLAGHAAGGVACALLLTACFSVLFAHLMSVAVLLPVLLVFLLPVGATVLTLLQASLRQRVFAFVLVALLLYLLLAERGDLALTLFSTFVMLPVLMLVIFGLRFWRGVAPMLLVVALASSLLAVAAVEFIVKGAGWVSAWPWRVAGFALGAWLGYRVLRALQVRHAQGRFSDLDLFVDAWWLAYLLVQTTVFLIMGRHAGYLLALAGFPLLWVVRHAVWRAWPLSNTHEPPMPLLLLRVFGDERRMQGLFDRLEQRWRHRGPIYMIAGWDLALRNIGPSDFVAFLSGTLRHQFVRDGADLQARLASLPAGRDADGRFRVSHFWCHANTWKPTMRALASRSRAVLMDLRGFTRDREGCRYELLHLAQHAADLPVLLLVDSPTAYAELRALLGGTEVADAPWVVADLAADAVALDHKLYALLAGQRP